MEHKDGSSFAWGYNDEQVTVTFTNGVSEDPGEDPGDEPTYTNLIDEVGTVDNIRLRSSGGTAEADAFASGYIPVSANDSIYVKFPNGDITKLPSNGQLVCVYEDTNGTIIGYYRPESDARIYDVTNTGYRYGHPGSAAYIRVAGAPAGAHTGWVVTKNEPIE
jgi:hypothetical protein